MNITEQKRTELWQENFKLLVEYMKVHGRPPKYDAYFEGKKLGRWFYAQKECRKKGTLSAEYEKLLISLGVDFASTKKDFYEEKWQRNFGLLTEFVQENGRWPTQKVEYKGFKVGNWLLSQKVAYRKGVLSPEREAKLRSIGIEL